MGIFRFRPLAATCVLLILTVAVAFVLPDTVALICICVCAALLVGACLWAVIKGMTYPRLLLVLLLLGVCLGLGRVYFRHCRTEAVIGDKINTVVTAEIQVERITGRTSYSSALLVKVTALNDERASARAMLMIDGVSPYYVGDCLRGSFFCLPLEECIYYEGQDTEYMADGAVVALKLAEKPVLVADGTHCIRTRLVDLRDALHHRLTAVVTGEEGELLSALLFGTKDRLEGATVRNFRRMGLSHLLALSGLHLGMISMLADRLLLLLRVGRRWRIPAVIFFCFAYLCLTGFTFSMLRAVLMLSVLYLSFYAKEDYDALTSLALVGALILLWQPYAILDLSFQMTVLATFGILAFGDIQGRLKRWLPDRRGIAGFGLRQVRRFLASLLLTVSATLALLPVQWLVFGEISLMTPLSNLVMVPLCVPVLIFGVAVTALSASPALAGPCGRVAALLPHCMLRIAERVAATDCMLSLRYDFVPFVLVPALALTFVILVVRIKRARLLVWAPSVLAVLAFVVCIPLQSDGIQAVYRNTGRNEGVILAQCGDVILCDLSNGSQNQLYSDYRLAQSLRATDVDVLMLTHYHSRQTASLAAFASAVLVRELWLPPPADEEDVALLRELTQIAEREGVTVRRYGYGEALNVFEKGSVTLAEPLFEKRSVEPALVLHVESDKRLVYMSAAYSEYARNAGVSDALPPCDTLILGGHGPVPHAAILPVLEALPQQIVLANEEILILFEPLDGTEYILYPTERILDLSAP